ncbi:MAG: PilZ domain-containing protein [Nitrospirae bacterium]|nr:PilZ domain-containing protein [Nitrospirota bacterium]
MFWTWSLTEDENAVPFEALVANISLAGLGLYSSEAIKPGTAASIEIEFLAANGMRQKDTIRGRVVHCAGRGNLYFVGISFAELMNPMLQPALHFHFSKIISWN